MQLEALKQLLSQHPDKRLAFQLPEGKLIPPHFHITELGLVTKSFVDCGGTKRSSKACMLQIWVANDTQHVLKASKLNEILSHSAAIGLSDEDVIECEYQSNHLSIFSLDNCQVTDVAIVFNLTNKQTACLSPDKCGLDAFGNPTGCC